MRVVLATALVYVTGGTFSLFAFIYLLGVAAIVLIRRRLVARTLEVLRESEAKYRALVESVPAIVYIADLPLELVVAGDITGQHSRHAQFARQEQRFAERAPIARRTSS